MKHVWWRESCCGGPVDNRVVSRCVEVVLSSSTVDFRIEQCWLLRVEEIFYVEVPAVETIRLESADVLARFPPILNTTTPHEEPFLLPRTCATSLVCHFAKFAVNLSRTSDLTWTSVLHPSAVASIADVVVPFLLSLSIRYVDTVVVTEKVLFFVTVWLRLLTDSLLCFSFLNPWLFTERRLSSESRLFSCVTLFCVLF